MLLTSSARPAALLPEAIICTCQLMIVQCFELHFHTIISSFANSSLRVVGGPENIWLSEFGLLKTAELSTMAQKIIDFNMKKRYIITIGTLIS